MKNARNVYRICEIATSNGSAARRIPDRRGARSATGVIDVALLICTSRFSKTDRDGRRDRHVDVNKLLNIDVTNFKRKCRNPIATACPRCRSVRHLLIMRARTFERPTPVGRTLSANAAKQNGGAVHRQVVMKSPSCGRVGVLANVIGEKSDERVRLQIGRNCLTALRCVPTRHP